MSGPVAVLVGPPGAEVPAVATLLASLLGVGARDTDADVEKVAGKPLGEIFVDDGEPAFRDLERSAVAAALASHDGVLAIGGGAVVDSGTQLLLEVYVAQGGTIAFLDVSLAHAAPRIGLNQARPLVLGNPRSQWQALMDARRPIYDQISTVRISTDDATPAHVADTIYDLLKGAP
jgi:shikimate kinase